MATTKEFAPFFGWRLRRNILLLVCEILIGFPVVLIFMRRDSVDIFAGTRLECLCREKKCWGFVGCWNFLLGVIFENYWARRCFEYTIRFMYWEIVVLNFLNFYSFVEKECILGSNYVSEKNNIEEKDDCFLKLMKKIWISYKKFKSGLKFSVTSIM